MNPSLGSVNLLEKLREMFYLLYYWFILEESSQEQLDGSNSRGAGYLGRGAGLPCPCQGATFLVPPCVHHPKSSTNPVLWGL